MKKKIIHRIATLASAAVISVGAICMFAGCTSKTPRVTITYSFDGEEYAVRYQLSRTDAPETVQHFIELANAGYYEGTVIHDYDANFLRGGGYTIEDGMLKEKDYFTIVKQLEAEGAKFTQTVFKNDEEKTPLYTVRGEFKENYTSLKSGKTYFHSRGALVMDYSDKGKFNYTVTVKRADGGKANDGDPYDPKSYSYNSATSLFYTYLGNSNTTLDKSKAVFGRTIDYEDELAPLLDKIADYIETLGEDETFTTAYEDFPERLYLNTLEQGEDPDFVSLRRANLEAESFHTPLKKPIIITSVKVTKY